MGIDEFFEKKIVQATLHQEEIDHLTEWRRPTAIPKEVWHFAWDRVTDIADAGDLVSAAEVISFAVLAALRDPDQFKG